MIDMTKGSPTRLITKFAVPLLLGNVLQQMYNIVDSIVVGNFVGKEALAAVGTSFIIVFLLTSLFAGLGMGATILISQFLGSGQKEKLKLTVDTMYISILVGGLLITFLGIIIARPFLELMNTPEGITIEMANTYLTTIFAGTLATFGYSVNTAILQGIGDSKSSLLFLAIATVINIVLDLVFVIVFNMGVFGVALATIIAQSFSFLFGIWYINRKITIFHISFKKMQFSGAILKKSFRIGLPAGFQNILFCVGTIVLQRLINSYGPSFMAGYSAVNKIDAFVFMPIASFSTAITTYVGQNVGARDLDRVKQGVRSTLILSVSLALTISALMLIFGRYLLMAFTQDAEVLHTGQEFLKRIMPGYFLLAIIFTLNSAVRGSGQAVIPMIASMTALLGARVPSAYIYNHFFGQYNIFWCFGTGWLIGISIIIPYYLSGHWKKKAFQFISS